MKVSLAPHTHTHSQWAINHVNITLSSIVSQNVLAPQPNLTVMSLIALEATRCLSAARGTGGAVWFLSAGGSGAALGAALPSEIIIRISL